MRTIDLFSGCGGLSLGFQKGGFDVLAAYDNWQPAIEIYQMNFSHKIHNVDLSDIKDYNIFKDYSPEMIIGGPPCQDFSSAGNRNEEKRADLTLNFAQIVATVKPTFFVMENVERIIVTQTLSKAKYILSSAGYTLHETVLNASICGVPQLRKRYFLIGELDGDVGLLPSYLNHNLAETPLSIFDYLGNTLGTEHYYRHPRSYARRGVFSIYEPSPTIRGVNRPIPPNYQFHEGDTCKDLHKIRPLTFKERSLIQTFPQDFIWESKSKSNLEQAIGNAVPVNLAEYVAKAIRDYVANKPLMSRVKQTDFQLSIFA